MHTKWERILFSLVALCALAFVYLPLLGMYADSVVADGGLDFSPYVQMVHDARVWRLLVRSVALALGVTAATCALGVPTALLLGRGRFRRRKVLGVLLLGPLAVPPHVHASAWIALAGGEGLVNRAAQYVLHLDRPPISIYGVRGTILVLTLAYYPIVTLFTLASLASVARPLEEAALLCTPTRKALRRVTLRLALPGVLSGAAVVYAFALSNFGVPAVLRVNTYPLEIFSRFATAYDLRSAVAQSLPLLVAAVAPVLAAMSLVARRRRLGAYGVVGSHSGRSSLTFAAGYGGTLFLVIVGAASFLVPMAALLARLASPGQLVQALRETYPQAGRSWCLGLGVFTAATMVGFVVGYGIARRSLPLPEILEVLAFAPVAIPATVVGLGLISTWNRSGFWGFVYGTPLLLIGAFCVRLTPLLTRVSIDTVAQIQAVLEEAAALHGARRPRNLTRIVLPLAAPALVAGAAICFVLAMGELGATVLLQPPGFDTLSLRLFMLMHYGTQSAVAAAGLFLVAQCLAVGGVMMAAGARRMRG